LKVKHERATEEIRELAALYALGSLTQHEAHSFEVHMREGCSICEVEFRRFEHIVAGIGFTANEVAPPDYVRDLLLARIEREHRPAAASTQNNSPETKPTQPPPVFTSASKPIFAQQPQKQSNLFSWVLTAVFALAALFMYFAWKSEQDTINQLQTKISVKETDSQELKILLANQKGKIGEFNQILSIANKPGAKISRLAGQPASPSAAGAILWDGAEEKYIAFGTLPSAPEGKVFQLWFLSSMTKIPAGLLRIDSNGRFFVTAPIPHDAANATVAAITLEPDNGSQIPTLPFHAIGRITD
jgi:anti-sigma-K factor RskA